MRVSAGSTGRAWGAVLAVWCAGCSGGATADAGSGDAGSDDAAAAADAGEDAGSSADGGSCHATALTPAARGDAVGVVDPATGLLWVVGGDVGTPVNCMPSPSFAADVFTYDPACDVWTEKTFENGPSARARAAATLDTRRRRLVMFGGRYRASFTGAYTLYNEVWALDLATETWTQIMATGGPSARANASVVYDETSDELVVFGGNTSTSGLSFTPQNDTWAMDLGAGTWRRVQTTGTPPAAREFHAAAILGRTMVVVDGGGADAFQGPFFNDAYALDLATGAWSSLALHGDNPQGRIGAALAPDPAGQRLLLIAGHDDGALGNRNDVFSLALDGTLATLVPGDDLNNASSNFCDFPPDFATTDLNAPERRSAFVAAPDPARGRVLVFGGKTDCGITDDVWSVDTATGAWRSLRFSTVGVSCERSGRTGCTTLCQ